MLKLKTKVFTGHTRLFSLPTVMKRLPPIEKIYEALTAIADRRVQFDSDRSLAEGSAHVTASSSSKCYDVNWDLNTYSSNDNGTYWQGYPGYPVIAVLMLQGKLPYDEMLGRQLANVKWKEVIHRHGNNYREAVSEVLHSRAIDSRTAGAIVQNVFSELERLPIAISRSSFCPPVA